MNIDINVVTQIVFYLGATMAVGSFAIKNVFYLRLTALGACTCFIAYYLLLGTDMNPVISNVLIAIINSVYLFKMSKKGREWKALQRYKRMHRKRKDAK